MTYTDNAVFKQVAEKHVPEVFPTVTANAGKNFFGPGAAIPKNPAISDGERRRVMELSGSITSPLPHDRMVDNSLALRATKQFGVA